DPELQHHGEAIRETFSRRRLTDVMRGALHTICFSTADGSDANHARRGPLAADFFWWGKAWHPLAEIGTGPFTREKPARTSGPSAWQTRRCSGPLRLLRGSHLAHTDDAVIASADISR